VPPGLPVRPSGDPDPDGPSGSRSGQAQRLPHGVTEVQSGTRNQCLLSRHSQEGALLAQHRQPCRPSRVPAIRLLTIVSLVVMYVGSPVEDFAGKVASAAQDEDATVPVVVLDVEPASAPVGEHITVTGSVSGGVGAGSWDFTIPAFADTHSQSDNVLELLCSEAGTGWVTATYTDDSGAGHADGRVSCTSGITAPPSTESPSATPPPSDSSSPTTEPEPTGTSPTPPPSSSPTATPDDPLREKVDEAERQLESGVVSYRPPTSLAEGETADFVVRVQRDSTPADPEDVPGEGAVVTIPIEVGTPMSARLIGDDFDIQPPDARRRVLGSNRPAEWSWIIKPTSSGEKKLRLELAVLLDDENDTPIAVRRYVQTIDVSVHLLHTSARLIKSALGALTAMGLTAAALVGAAWSWWRRRRRGSTGSGAGEGSTPPKQVETRRPPVRPSRRPHHGGTRRHIR
jgi:hypothetical protein